jgi:hypothetical protein
VAWSARCGGPRPARAEGAGAGPHRRGGNELLLETLAYRLLVVCALLGVANSNPTLRGMLDALL